MFRGATKITLDDKGRMVMPTRYRDQIAALKAFGYSNLGVGIHYLKLVLVVAVVGVILGSICGYWFGLNITKIYRSIRE